MRIRSILILVLALSACASNTPTVTPTVLGTPIESTTPAPVESSPPPSAPATTCSASKLSADARPQPGLPDIVASVRAEIVRAAVACDYSALDAIPGPVKYSFGGETESPGTYWKKQEAGGSPVLSFLVKMLNLNFAEYQGNFVWPRAYQDKPSDADWTELQGLYTQKQIDEWRNQTYGTGYIGYRVGISPSGEWQFFVEGD